MHSKSWDGHFCDLHKALGCLQASRSHTQDAKVPVQSQLTSLSWPHHWQWETSTTLTQDRGSAEVHSSETKTQIAPSLLLWEI